MLPGKAERSLVERPEKRSEGGIGQQQRAGRKQQADGVVDRIDLVDQVVTVDEVEHIRVVGERRPGGEGEQRGPQRDPGPLADAQGSGDVGPRVPLVQMREDFIARRFDGGDDEQAAEAGQFRKQLPVPEDVLHLGRDVEGQLSAWPGPLRKSASVKLICRAPASTSARTSSRTICSGTMKNRPP